jgi:hypothetical protein
MSPLSKAMASATISSPSPRIGEIKCIEVRTTSGSANSSFFISANEVEFARQHRDNYHLYHVCQYEDNINSGRLYVSSGGVEKMFELTPTQYRAVRS